MRYEKEFLTGSYSKKDFCFFWGHKPAKSGKITKSCLSQWWQCTFREDNIDFCCAEQYMMYHKAVLFNDDESAKRILESTDPAEIKKLGRGIRNFDPEQWDQHKRTIVLRGNLLKFSQNPELKNFLLSTGTKILVEASPYDKIWGIGMNASSEGICDPSNWKGQNLLGFVLMSTRDQIR